MNIKSNTPLSDAEMKQIRAIMRESKCPQESLSSTFPDVKVKVDGETVYFGAPPWDISQEV